MRTGILSDESVMRDCADYQSLPMNVGLSGPTGPTGPTGPSGLKSRPQSVKTMMNNVNSITETQFNLIMDQHRRKIPQRPVALPAPPMRDVSGPQPLDYTNAPQQVIRYVAPPPQSPPPQSPPPQSPTPQPTQTPQPPASPPTLSSSVSSLIKKLTGNGNGNKTNPTYEERKGKTQANELKRLSNSQGYEAAQGTEKRSGKTRIQTGTMLKKTEAFQRRTPKSSPGAPSTSREVQEAVKFGAEIAGGPQGPH